MQQSSERGNPRLIAVIRDEIDAQGGQISFDRFMEMALYHPAHGYYMAEARRPGRGGDFITAPEASAHFGNTLARQMADCWERLGKPGDWSIREYGAGIGGLAYDIMAGLANESPRAFETLTYRMVEINRVHQLEALRAMAEVGLAEKVGIEPPGSPANAITGVLLANEVADALPVHRLRLTDEGWMEAFVCWTGDGFGWQLDAMTPESGTEIRELSEEHIDFAVHDIVEVSPAAAAWFQHAASGLDRGYAVVIDYGYPAAQLYRDHRLDGTLRGYAGHTVTDDPFTRVGEQDLTAHVDFTALRKAGEAAGLIHAGYTTQGAFLSSLGLGDVLIRLQQDSAATVEDYLAAQAVILRLIDPGGLGRFGVMVMARDAPIDPALRGFEIEAPDF